MILGPISISCTMYNYHMVPHSWEILIRWIAKRLMSRKPMEGACRKMRHSSAEDLWSLKALFLRRLAGPVVGTCDSWSQGHKFKPHVRCRDTWKQKLKKKKYRSSPCGSTWVLCLSGISEGDEEDLEWIWERSKCQCLRLNTEQRMTWPKCPQCCVAGGLSFSFTRSRRWLRFKCM